MSRVKSRLSFLSVGAMFSFDIQDVLVERFKSSIQVFKSNWVFEKDVASKYSLRLPQMEYTRFPRAANEPPCPGKGYADVVASTRGLQALAAKAVLSLPAPETGRC